jgi:hypothetical protein
LPQSVGAGEVGFDGGFEFLDNGQAALDFSDDAVLFHERRKRNWQPLYITYTEMFYATANRYTVDQRLHNRRH